MSDETQDTPQAEDVVPTEFETYWLVFLKKGPAWTGVASPELEARQLQHLGHLTEMAESGKMLVAGPLEDAPEGLRGICLFPTDKVTREELEAMMANDPHVRVDHLAVEIMKWWMPKGGLQRQL